MLEEEKNHTATTCFCFRVRETGADWAAGSRVFGTVSQKVESVKDDGTTK